MADPEALSRQLVAACGLGWNDRCLSFYRTERAVLTASKLQWCMRPDLSTVPWAAGKCSRPTSIRHGRTGPPRTPVTPTEMKTTELEETAWRWINLLVSWLKKLLENKSRRSRRLRSEASRLPAQIRRRPTLELLEDRITPTNWVVSVSTPDSATTVGTLRYAVTTSVAGDTISFASCQVHYVLDLPARCRSCSRPYDYRNWEPLIYGCGWRGNEFWGRWEFQRGGGSDCQHLRPDHHRWPCYPGQRH